MAFLDKFSPAASAPVPADPARQVIEHLNHVLNTRRGFGWFRPDFGMNDPDAHATRTKIAEAVMRDVRENIERHEPRVRIREIVTEPVENPLRLAFTVRCTVLDDARALHLEFDTVFKSFSVGSR